MIRTIYLDLDDVLNTFTPYVLSYFGVPTASDDYSTYPGRSPLHLAARRLTGTPWTKSRFWDEVPRSVWVTTPKSAECDRLLRACKRAVGAEVYIATSPTKDPDCLAGKLEWIHHHLPKWIRRQYFITPRKWKLARPDALLIDDNEANCRRFEAEGGNTIRFPRPWNDAHHEEPADYLARCLSFFTGLETF